MMLNILIQIHKNWKISDKTVYFYNRFLLILTSVVIIQKNKIASIRTKTMKAIFILFFILFSLPNLRFCSAELMVKIYIMYDYGH